MVAVAETAVVVVAEIAAGQVVAVVHLRIAGVPVGAVLAALAVELLSAEAAAPAAGVVPPAAGAVPPAAGAVAPDGGEELLPVVGPAAGPVVYLPMANAYWNNSMRIMFT